MKNKQSGRAYTAIKRLVSEHGGTMRSKGAGRGVWWHIVIAEGRLSVRVPNQDVNALDELYVQPVPAPTTWNDFPLGEETPLMPNALELLIALIRTHGTPS